ncbi:hypothetical protein PTKIN_Ptkin08bG0083900 [Pterospermum kingtungense]
MKRGFTASGDFSLCRGQLEDINHVLRKCKAVDGIWRALLPAAEYEKQKVMMFDEWLRRNLLSQVCCDSYNEWQSHFTITLWWLWRWRNERVFSTQVRTMESQLAWLRGQFQEVRSAFHSGSLWLEEERMYITRYLRWIPPEKDWVKLNTDGYSKTIRERAAYGGLFRDQSGNWLGGFMANLGREQNCVVDHLALMALHQLRGAHWLERLPPEIDHLLQKDRGGFVSTRRVLLDA